LFIPQEWTGGVYPGEGWTDEGWYYELRYSETGEFEYVPEEKIWSTVEPAGDDLPDSHGGNT